RPVPGQSFHSKARLRFRPPCCSGAEADRSAVRGVAHCRKSAVRVRWTDGYSGVSDAYLRVRVRCGCDAVARFDYANFGDSSNLLKLGTTEWLLNATCLTSNSANEA